MRCRASGQASSPRLSARRTVNRAQPGGAAGDGKSAREVFGADYRAPQAQPDRGRQCRGTASDASSDVRPGCHGPYKSRGGGRPRTMARLGSDSAPNGTEA